MAEHDSANEDIARNYVFISYSHHDRDRVDAEIQRLEATGISTWYDRAIRPGSTWSQELADALSGAEALVFFATRRSIDSDNCADEIVYALDEKIPVVTIYLDEVQLPGALRLRLASRQAIYKPRLSTAEYDEKLASLLSLTQHGGILTSSGRRRLGLRRGVIVSSLIVAAMVAAAVLVLSWDRPEQPAPEPALASLAVLPFLTMQADADGLGMRLASQTIGQLSSEPLRARFAPFATLKDKFYVAPAAASIRDWSEVSLPDLRRVLNVNYIVDGAAQLTPSVYVVDARLSRLSDGYQVFSVNLERPAHLALAAEQEIGSILALEVINAIAADQFRQTYSARFGSAPWFDLFMTGSREFFEGSMGSATDYQLVAENMERALELGMPFAMAQHALVQADLARRGRSISPIDAMANLERDATELASAKGPLSADHVRSIAALYLALDYAAAESYAMANLERFPNSTGSLLTMAGVRQRQGKAAEGIRWFERAVAGGANGPGVLHEYALALSAAGDPAKALVQLEEGFRYYARPFGRGTFMALKTRLLHTLGRSEEAARVLDEGLEIYGREVPEQFAYPLALLGRQAEARAMLDRMIPQADTARISNFMIFEVYLGLGEFEAAIPWLRKAVDSRDLGAIRWLHAPDGWGAISDSPGLRDVLASLHAQEHH